MPLYRYTALAASGTTTKGQHLAASPEALALELAAAGLKLIRAQPARQGMVGAGGAECVAPAQLLLFVQELLALVRAGLAIPDALALASRRPESPRLARVIRKVLEDVRAGALLSEACALHPAVFGALFVAAIRTGEKSGDLTTALARFLDYLKQRIAVRRKLSQALVYPLFLLIALSVVMVALFVFVLPRFAAMYADFDAPLPAPTRLLLALVGQLPLLAGAFVGAALLGWAALRRWGTPELRLLWDRVRESLPYLGALHRTEAVALLARSLSALLVGGTPLVEALRAAQATVPGTAQQARLARATRQVNEGGSLARAISAAGLMPETAVKMVEVGEATGRLDAMLAEIAQFYEDLLEQRLSRVMALVEPLLMLLMGLLIGGIIIVMYLPIFNLAAVIR